MGRRERRERPEGKVTTMQQKCEYMLRCMISYCRKLLRKEVRVNLYGGGVEDVKTCPRPNGKEVPYLKASG